MTWGSPSYISGESSNACLACHHIAACHANVRVYAPVLCEDPLETVQDQTDANSHRRGCAWNWTYYIQPGELITAPILAARTGADVQAASEWCTNHCRSGLLQFVGKAPQGPHGGTRPRLYRYSPAGMRI